jgi:hypothetical protein
MIGGGGGSASTFQFDPDRTFNLDSERTFYFIIVLCEIIPFILCFDGFFLWEAYSCHAQA